MSRLPADARFATRIVHAGLDPDPYTGGVVPAIHQSTTCVQQAPGDFVEDYEYSRSANPTRAALERALGELEGGLGSAFSSGMAAEQALVTAHCNAGEHAVIPDDLYGGTYRLFDKVRARFIQNAVGSVPGPLDCFLVHRGLRTLHLRMAAHAEAAQACAEFLHGAAGVSAVYYPGFGGMVSFRHPDAVRMAAATRIFSLAESLGGVESLIEVPQAMTHQSVEGSAAAVPADLVRLSCGIEAAEDLVEDLRQALV